MKVKLEIELDIPEIEGWSPGEVGQLVFDAYTNYVTVSHLEDAMHWLCKPEDGGTTKQIVDYHNTWAGISRDAKTKMVIE